MVKALQQIEKGCRGVEKVLTTVADKGDQASLTYLGVYACGFSGRGSLDRFRSLNFAVADSSFLVRIESQVAERRKVPGWVVQKWDDENIYFRFGSIRAYLPKARVDSRCVLSKGLSIAMDVPVISPRVLPGFIYRHGNEECGKRPISRFYLNIGQRQAAWVLGPLAERLDTARVPYDMKVLAHPRAYVRRDAAVVYVPSDIVPEAERVLTAALARDGVTLHKGAPLLTREVAPGIGFADDPSDVAPGRSHGQWVSWLFLEAARKQADPRRRAMAVSELVESFGRNPEEPYRRGQRI